MDESLKTLEREVELAPDDTGLGWRLVTALDRAGERRRSFLELSRLARQGDGAADERLRAARDPRPPLGSDPVFRTWSIAERLDAPKVKGSILVAGSMADPTLVAFDVGRGERLWTARLSLGAVEPYWGARKKRLYQVVGDDLVHADASGLVLRDLATGEIRARAPLAAPCHELQVLNDRAVVTTDDGPQDSLRSFSIVDVGREFGRLLFGPESGVSRAFLTRATTFTVVRPREPRMEVRALDGFRVLERHGALPADDSVLKRNRALGAWIAAHDMSQLGALALADLGDDRVLLRVGYPPDLVLVSTSGDELWRWRPDPGDNPVVPSDATVRAGGNAIVFLSMDAEKRVSVVGVDGGTGDTSFRVPVPEVEGLYVEAPPLVASDGIVVVASSPLTAAPATVIAVLSEPSGREIVRRPGMV